MVRPGQPRFSSTRPKMEPAPKPSQPPPATTSPISPTGPASPDTPAGPANPISAAGPDRLANDVENPASPVDTTPEQPLSEVKTPSASRPDPVRGPRLFNPIDTLIAILSPATTIAVHNGHRSIVYPAIVVQTSAIALWLYALEGGSSGDEWSTMSFFRIWTLFAPRMWGKWWGKVWGLSRLMGTYGLGEPIMFAGYAAVAFGVAYFALLGYAYFLVYQSHRFSQAGVASNLSRPVHHLDYPMAVLNSTALISMITPRTTRLILTVAFSMCTHVDIFPRFFLRLATKHQFYMSGQDLFFGILIGGMSVYNLNQCAKAFGTTNQF